MFKRIIAAATMSPREAMAAITGAEDVRIDRRSEAADELRFAIANGAPEAVIERLRDELRREDVKAALSRPIPMH